MYTNNFEKDFFWDEVKKARRIGISAHVRPDGDAISSCLAMYDYITDNYNKDGAKTVDIFSMDFSEKFLIMKNSDKFITNDDYKEPYDLFIVLDCGSIDRVYADEKIVNGAGEVFLFDHHVSNTGFAKYQVINSESASTTELIFDYFDEDKISKECAIALYMGIIHDTGVFKHTNTTERTMVVAGKLLSIGKFNQEELIDGTFYAKSYKENQILGRALMESIMLANGKIIVSWLNRKIMDFYGVESKNLEGIIDQLRVTDGVEVAIFIYETADLEYKISMRSNGVVDVAKTAVFFGGGGHVKAAGCTMRGQLYDCINNLTLGICHQLEEHGVKID